MPCKFTYNEVISTRLPELADSQHKHRTITDISQVHHSKVLAGNSSLLYSLHSPLLESDLHSMSSIP